MGELILYSVFIILLVVVVYFLRIKKEKKNRVKELMSKPFSEKCRSVLTKKVLFYRHLDSEDKQLFEKQILRFLER